MPWGAKTLGVSLLKNNSLRCVKSAKLKRRIRVNFDRSSLYLAFFSLPGQLHFSCTAQDIYLYENCLHIEVIQCNEEGKFTCYILIAQRLEQATGKALYKCVNNNNSNNNNNNYISNINGV